MALSAGVLDAGLASLATFGASLTATTQLDLSTLGAYAVFFSAFVFASSIPTQLVFLPAEVALVEIDSRPERLRSLARTLTIGAPAALASALIVVPAALVASAADNAPLLALMTTAAGTMAVSPLQDHTRRMLHLAGSSWAAAAVSAIQLVVVVALLAAFAGFDVPAVWRPFGALAVGNMLSTAAGVAWCRGRGLGSPHALRARDILRRGRWLLVGELVPSAEMFLGSALIALIASAEVLGYAEAARVAAQPVLVLGVGLNAVLAPRIMEASRSSNADSIHASSRAFHLLLGAGSAAYLALVAFSWTGNPLARLVPPAYEVTGLVAVAVLASLTKSWVFPLRAQLVATGQERRLALVEPLAAPAALGVAFASGALGAFAAPASAIASGGVRYGRYRSFCHRRSQEGAQERVFTA